jgi:hypothetical protein
MKWSGDTVIRICCQEETGQASGGRGRVAAGSEQQAGARGKRRDGETGNSMRNDECGMRNDWGREAKSGRRRGAEERGGSPDTGTIECGMMNAECGMEHTGHRRSGTGKLMRGEELLTPGGGRRKGGQGAVGGWQRAASRRAGNFGTGLTVRDTGAIYRISFSSCAGVAFRAIECRVLQPLFSKFLRFKPWNRVLT